MTALVAGATVVAILLIVGRAVGGGSFDQSFSGDGKRTTDLGGDEDLFAVESAGKKLVVAGYADAADRDFSVSRYRVGGAADNQFSDDGHAGIDFGPDSEASDLAVQRNGRVVAVGRVDAGPGVFDLAVARLRRDGTPDSSFSTDGERVYDLGVSAMGNAVAVRRSGAILIAARTLAGTADFKLVRLLPDGTPDPGFGGGDGIAEADFGGVDRAEALLLRGRGKTLVMGSTDAGGAGDIALATFRRSGALDSSFSGDGRRRLDLSGDQTPTDMDAAPGGRLVVSATANGNWLVARMRPGGALDKSFSGDGVKPFDPGGTGDLFGGIASAGARTVVAGETNRSGDRRFALARYGRRGRFDKTFSGDGFRTFSIVAGADSEGARDVLVQRDGKIVAVGFSFDGSGDQALVRLRP